MKYYFVSYSTPVGFGNCTIGFDNPWCQHTHLAATRMIEEQEGVANVVIISFQEVVDCNEVHDDAPVDISHLN